MNDPSSNSTDASRAITESDRMFATNVSSLLPSSTGSAASTSDPKRERLAAEADVKPTSNGDAKTIGDTGSSGGRGHEGEVGSVGNEERKVPPVPPFFFPEIWEPAALEWDHELEQVFGVDEKKGRPFANSAASREVIQQLRRYARRRHQGVPDDDAKESGRPRIYGRSVLLAGARGTGKTSTVLWTIRELQAELNRAAQGSCYIDKTPEPVRLLPIVIPASLIMQIGPCCEANDPCANAKKNDTASTPTSRVINIVDQRQAEVGPKAQSAKKSQAENETKNKLLIEMCCGLHRAVVREFLRCIRERLEEFQDECGLYDPPPYRVRDRFEILAQFEQDIEDIVHPARLREIWRRLGFIRGDATGSALFSHDLLLPTYQAIEEVSLLTTLNEFYLRLVGTVFRESSNSDGIAHEVGSKATTGKADEKKPLDYRAVIAGLLGATTASATSRSLQVTPDTVITILWGIVGATLAGVVGTMFPTWQRQSSRIKKEIVTKNYSLETLPREIPRLIDEMFQVGLCPVFIVDELDKIADLDTQMECLLMRLKQFFAEDCFFFFLTNRQFLDGLHERERRDPNGPHSTWFQSRYYIEFMPWDVRSYLRDRIRVRDGSSPDERSCCTQSPNPLSSDQLYLAERERTIWEYVLIFRAGPKMSFVHRELRWLTVAQQTGTIRLGETIANKKYLIEMGFQLAAELVLDELLRTGAIREGNGDISLFQLALGILGRCWQEERVLNLTRRPAPAPQPAENDKSNDASKKTSKQKRTRSAKSEDDGLVDWTLDDWLDDIERTVRDGIKQPKEPAPLTGLTGVDRFEHLQNEMFCASKKSETRESQSELFEEHDRRLLIEAIGRMVELLLRPQSLMSAVEASPQHQGLVDDDGILSKLRTELLPICDFLPKRGAERQIRFAYFKDGSLRESEESTRLLDLKLEKARTQLEALGEVIVKNMQSVLPPGPSEILNWGTAMQWLQELALIDRSPPWNEIATCMRRAMHKESSNKIRASNGKKVGKFARDVERRFEAIACGIMVISTLRRLVPTCDAARVGPAMQKWLGGLPADPTMQAKFMEELVDGFPESSLATKPLDETASVQFDETARYRLRAIATNSWTRGMKLLTTYLKEVASPVATLPASISKESALLSWNDLAQRAIYELDLGGPFTPDVVAGYLIGEVSQLGPAALLNPNLNQMTIREWTKLFLTAMKFVPPAVTDNDADGSKSHDASKNEEWEPTHCPLWAGVVALEVLRFAPAQIVELLNHVEAHGESQDNKWAKATENLDGFEQPFQSIANRIRNSLPSESDSFDEDDAPSTDGTSATVSDLNKNVALVISNGPTASDGMLRELTPNLVAPCLWISFAETELTARVLRELGWFVDCLVLSDPSDGDVDATQILATEGILRASPRRVVFRRTLPPVTFDADEELMPTTKDAAVERLNEIFRR